jgi:hypothetical protein
MVGIGGLKLEAGVKLETVVFVESWWFVWSQQILEGILGKFEDC